MHFLARLAITALIGFLLPVQTFAWGANAERLIANRAVETLPSDIRPFFEANRDFITRHAADPVENAQNAQKNGANESHDQVLFLDRYGQYPFSALPRKYEAALAKFGRLKLESGGLLPWQIGVYSAKLTDAMRSGNWEQARLIAAQLAGYVAQAFDPFDTTEDYEGRAWSQPGVNLRFDTSLVDRYSLFFPLRPNDAQFIADPTDHAFEDCITAHSWLEIVLVADRRARVGLSDYTDDYYDRFYSEAGATLIRQLSDAASDVGSYWLTSWINAGRPALPH
jgi:hypothetical protein